MTQKPTMNVILFTVRNVRLLVVIQPNCEITIVAATADSTKCKKVSLKLGWEGLKKGVSLLTFFIPEKRGRCE